jgi:hypothetical protein
VDLFEGIALEPDPWANVLTRLVRYSSSFSGRVAQFFDERVEGVVVG